MLPFTMFINYRIMFWVRFWFSKPSWNIHDILEVYSDFIDVSNTPYSKYGKLTWLPLGHAWNIWIITLESPKFLHTNYVLCAQYIIGEISIRNTILIKYQCKSMAILHHHKAKNYYLGPQDALKVDAPKSNKIKTIFEMPKS